MSWSCARYNIIVAEVLVSICYVRENYNSTAQVSWGSWSFVSWTIWVIMGRMKTVVPLKYVSLTNLNYKVQTINDSIPSHGFNHTF